MVLEDIANLFEQVCKKETASCLAARFEKSRKWVHLVRGGCPMVLNWQFIAGLDSLGYELVLRKKRMEE